VDPIRGRQAQGALALAQGAVFLTLGLWPIFDMRSFEKVTGPKTDYWLVKTVGLLLAATGGGLLYQSAQRKDVPKSLALVAATQALALGGVSSVYSLRGRISKIYLLDAVMESAFVASWIGFQRTSEARKEQHMANNNERMQNNQGNQQNNNQQGGQQSKTNVDRMDNDIKRQGQNQGQGQSGGITSGDQSQVEGQGQSQDQQRKVG